MTNKSAILLAIPLIISLVYAPAFANTNSPLQTINLYGSLRVHSAFYDSNAEIQDNSSRIGLKFRQDINEQAALFARTEWSLNLVDNDVEFNIDQNPDSQLEEITTSEDDTFGTRLGHIGLDLKQYGQLTLGKQWSTYYDITQYTDRFFVFGTQASSTFNAGTDGGVTGTGRAEKSLAYRFTHNNFKFGLQTQLLGDTEDTIDSYGASISYRFNSNIDAGVAFNQANISSDAISTITDIDEDATATSFGIRYWQGTDNPGYHSKLYLAAVFTSQESNEVTTGPSTPVAYDSDGLEVVGHYKLTDKLMLMAGANYLEPRDLHQSINDDFKIHNYMITAAYWFTRQGLAYFENKINQDKDSSGTEQDNVYTIGLRYDFSFGE